VCGQTVQLQVPRTQVRNWPHCKSFTQIRAKCRVPTIAESFGIEWNVSERATLCGNCKLLVFGSTKECGCLIGGILGQLGIDTVARDYNKPDVPTSAADRAYNCLRCSRFRVITTPVVRLIAQER
jgi:hypothetical protein